MPGTEQSARQAAAAREAEGQGRSSSSAAQEEPGGMFAAKADEGPGLFDAPQTKSKSAIAAVAADKLASDLYDAAVAAGEIGEREQIALKQKIDAIDQETASRDTLFTQAATCLAGGFASSI